MKEEKICLSGIQLVGDALKIPDRHFKEQLPETYNQVSLIKL